MTRFGLKGGDSVDSADFVAKVAIPREINTSSYRSTTDYTLHNDDYRLPRFVGCAMVAVAALTLLHAQRQAGSQTFTQRLV